MCVAIYHTIWITNLNASAFFENGPVLIDLFFIFSGFLMFTLYGGMSTGEEAIRFFRRRLARLYPVHFTLTMVVLLYAIVRLVAHHAGITTLDPGEAVPLSAAADDNVWSLLSNLLLIQAWGVEDGLTYNVPAWTISAEMATYIVFAAICVWVPLRTPWQFGLLGTGVAAIYATLALAKPDMNITYDLAVWRCLAGFGTGVLCARLHPHVARTFAEMGRMMATLWELAAALGFGAFVIWLPGKGQFLVGLFGFLFVAVFAQDRGLVSAALARAPFQHLGKLSYSIYMVHFIIAIAFGIFAAEVMPRVFGPEWNGWSWAGDLLLLPYLAAVWVAAMLLYHWVEAPAARALRERHPRVRALPETA